MSGQCPLIPRRESHSLSIPLVVGRRLDKKWKSRIELRTSVAPTWLRSKKENGRFSCPKVTGFVNVPGTTSSAGRTKLYGSSLTLASLSARSGEDKEYVNKSLRGVSKAKCRELWEETLEGRPCGHWMGPWGARSAPRSPQTWLTWDTADLGVE